jgi:hypothetical protein
MKKLIVLHVAAAALSILVGCREDKLPEAVQTVEWYEAHKAERAERLAKCGANPGELAATPNCVNASHANSSATWSARGGIKAPEPLKFEKK